MYESKKILATEPKKRKNLVVTDHPEYKLGVFLGGVPRVFGLSTFDDKTKDFEDYFYSQRDKTKWLHYDSIVEAKYKVILPECFL